jgi:transposase
MKAATLKSACGREGGQTVGIDIGDRFSHFCVIDEEGNVTDRGRVRTLEEDLSALFKPMLRARIAIETGTHSGWIARLLEQFQHEVIVANAREVKLITRSNRKNDRVDAEKLARLARVDPLLLKPVTHRSEKTQLDLAKIKVRDRLVVARAI